MAIYQKEMFQQDLVIDVTGPDGNAYVLLGYAKNFAKELDLDPEEIVQQMTAGDYENLLHVFDTYFGDYVTILR